MSWAECECGLVFTSDSAFDRHFIKTRPATSPLDTYDLGCKTAADLETEGWRQNAAGRWTNRPPQPQDAHRTPLVLVPDAPDSTQGVPSGDSTKGTGTGVA